jgi:hypothetical protein
MHTSGRSVLKLHLHVNVTEIIIRIDGEEIQKGLKKMKGSRAPRYQLKIISVEFKWPFHE